uniref:Uncharacterized protein n=1 Tax=Chlorella vulgaris TaxID=3077 RepID=V9H0S3_CHLVU|nr:hypothetical protein ChvulCp095 [Chlorella vulgaris]pir/T07282/ hypothetical protein 48b - Chlorella vulgaris chloroplast [Chlorella vulgaris]BAA57930.1 unnamed protein product [Chlorella vulgaris]
MALVLIRVRVIPLLKILLKNLIQTLFFFHFNMIGAKWPLNRRKIHQKL